MQFNTLERKVRRLFGDEFDIVIERQDIIDWTNAAQVDIARKTNCLPYDIVFPARAFPIVIPDLYLMYRVTYGSPATPKTFTTLEQIDAESIGYGVQSVGTPARYYLRGNKIYLYPTPDTGDETNVTITYDRAPLDLHLVDPWFNYKGNNSRVNIPGKTKFQSGANSFSVAVDLQPSSWEPTARWCIGSQWGTTTPTKAWKFTKTNTGMLEVTLQDAGGTSTVDTSTVALPTWSNGTRVKLGFYWSNNPKTIKFAYSTNGGVSWVALGALLSATEFSNINAGVQGIQLGVHGASSADGVYFEGKIYGIQLWTSAAPVTDIGQGILQLEVDTNNDLDTVETPTISSFTSSSGDVVEVDSGILTSDPSIDLPIMYHEDVVRYVLARAYEKNENYEGQNMSDTYYQEGLAQRVFESTHGDESFPFVRPDPMDWT